MSDEAVVPQAEEPRLGSKENPIQTDENGFPTNIPDQPVVEPAPVQETVQQPEQVAPATLKQTEVVESKSNAIKQVSQLLNSKGVENGADIVRELAKTGEVSLAHQAELIEALGPEVANLAINQVKAEVQAKKEAGQAESNRIKEYTLNKFGGQDAEQVWGELQQWVTSSESPFSQNDRKAMERLLSKGGLGADMVIDKIHDSYKQSIGFTQQADLVMGDAPSTSSFKPLSKADYFEQKAVIVRKYGEGSREDKALDEQRMRSLQQGY
jgi:hypothetical protein